MKIIIDTNIWISYLIGKTLAELKKLINNPGINIIITDKLIHEIKETFERKHLDKYFKDENFMEFWKYLEEIKTTVEIDFFPSICRDEDDNYLLTIAEKTVSNFLITGDKDLLVLKEYKRTKILRFRDFMTNHYPDIE